MFKFIVSIWNKNWKGKLTIIGSILILSSASIGILYGVLTKAGDEGFLKHNELDLKWSKTDLPIICTADTKTVSQKHLDLYNKARKEINTKTKTDLLGPCVAWMVEDKSMPEFMTSGLAIRVANPGSVVDLVTEDPFKSHTGGTTKHKFDKRTGRILSASVWINPKADEKLLYRIWIHELGHVLGLGHDRTQDSIMYSVAAGRSKELSDKDIDLLRDTYK